MRKTLALALLLICVNNGMAQLPDEANSFKRKGFTFGFGTGMGALTLSTNDSITTSFAVTLPNLKIGYMVNKKLALQILLPASPYKLNNKSRGFEGVLISGQYWVKDRWWVLAGTGLTLDAPAFWTVKDPDKAVFNTGLPAFSLATGYELWRKRNFALDIQYRIYGGQANLADGGKRQGMSNMFILGFNWY